MAQKQKSTSFYLLDWARKLQGTSDVHQVIQLAHDEMCQRTSYSSCWLSLVSKDRQKMQILSVMGNLDLKTTNENLIEIDIASDPMLQEILESNEPVIVEDARIDPRTTKQIVETLGNRTIINIPLAYEDDRLGAFGIGTFWQDGVVPPKKSELDYLQAMASHLSMVVHRLRLEEQRNMLAEQLRQSQKLEALGKMAGGISHDFNNYLSVINGYVDLIRLRGIEANELDEFLLQIKEAVQKATALSNQILAFSRRQVVQLQPVNINVIISDLMKMITRLVSENIEFKVNKRSKLSNIYGDSGQLEQVILNLVLNACDAMPSGGALTIETQDVQIDENDLPNSSLAKVGNFVKLSVADTGEGMSQEVQNNIFEPFFTTKESGKGTGLGLSVVFGIVSQHDGFIDVASNLGNGTTFNIFFPKTADIPTSKIENSQESALLGTETLLVVEDDTAVRNMLLTLLQANGYNTVAAENGAEAIDLLEQRKEISLIVSDMVMPEKSALDIKEYLDLNRPELPMLIVSGYVSEGLQNKIPIDSRIKVLSKPIEPREILRVIRGLLQLVKPI